MNLYERRILPYLVHGCMRRETLAGYRQRLLSSASGRVLEIGIGSGLNLPFYPTTASRLVALDPSAKLLSMANDAKRRATLPVELLEASAEAIPLEDDSVDTLVTSWTLCSIPDAPRALREMRRVLRASGRLLFVEHGRAAEPRVTRWQDRLTPLWKRIAGGCHLNRPISHLIEEAGFHIEHMETGYMKGPKPMTYMYEGCASIR